MEEIVEIGFHFIDKDGNETSQTQIKTLPEYDETGIATLCNSFLNFLHTSGFDYIEDIKVGIKDGYFEDLDKKY